MKKNYGFGWALIGVFAFTIISYVISFFAMKSMWNGFINSGMLWYFVGGFALFILIRSRY